MEKVNENKVKLWLERFDCFVLSGKDNKRFLNGITTGNILNLKNEVFKTCWLTPNGILKSLIEINSLEESLEIIILVGDTIEIKKYFNDIIFPNDKVSISETFLISRYQEVNEKKSWRINKPIFFKDNDQEYSVKKENLNIMNSNDLKLWKIIQAFPSLGNEINGKNNPLELGLVDLVDFNKGCYLGQETMSKIRNVSSLKQEIRVWIAKNSSIDFESDNKNLYNNSLKEKSVGYITSFYKSDSQIIVGLAMIKRKYLVTEDSFFSEQFCQITINKSIGSNFL